MSSPAVLPSATGQSGNGRPISLEMLELSQFKENPNNARKHSRRQLAALKASVSNFGSIVPVIVDEHNQLLCGHARISAARALKLRKFPAIRVLHLTERQKRALMLADNRIAQLASWDDSALRRELKFLIDCSVEFDFSAIGFSAPEVNYVIERVDKAGNRKKNPSARVSALAVAKPDDFWRLGDHLLHCGRAHPDEVDAIIRRWQVDTGFDAIEERSGEPFNARERNLHDQ